jgi:DNA polymerase-3 subunit epsilon
MHEALFSIARALNIQRPLAFFDTETTGVNVDEDRIVEISFVKVMRVEAEAPGIPSGGFLAQAGGRLINPMRPIPKAASDIHGITDADVATAPTFGQVARELAMVFVGADVAAYNGRRFDVKLLAKEFERAGEQLAAKWLLEARILDPFIIFARREGRDLTAALKFYTNRELGEDAHGAEADTHAAIEVLAAQLVSYPDLPRTVEALHDYCEDRKPEWIDREGKLAWKDGQPCMNFGPHVGKSLQRMVASEPGFLQWMLGKDFVADDAKQIVRDALRRKFPTPPAGKVA